MTGTPAPKTFFVRDPFTEEVQGPMDVKALRLWFEQGGVEDWGVSKSRSGPWTQAEAVKGLAPPRKVEANSAESDYAEGSFYSDTSDFPTPNPPTQTAQSSDLPAPQAETDPDLPDIDHKKLGLIAVAGGLVAFLLGVSTENNVVGGLGLWTAIGGGIFAKFGGKIMAKIAKRKGKLPIPILGSGGISLLGLIIIISSMNADTSVESGYGRVHNIGLMQQQQNTMMIGGLIFVGGLIASGFIYLKNNNKD